MFAMWVYNNLYELAALCFSLNCHVLFRVGNCMPHLQQCIERVGYDSKSTLLSFNFATSRTESSSSFSAYHAVQQSVPINIKAKMDDMFKCQAAISVENRTRACNHIMISMDRQNMHSLRAIIT